MKILEFCRNKAFWLMDSLTGGQVRTALNVLRNCEDGLWSEEQIKAYQNEQLTKLLKHSVDTVPAYSGLAMGGVNN